MTTVNKSEMSNYKQNVNLTISTDHRFDFLNICLDLTCPFCFLCRFGEGGGRGV